MNARCTRWLPLLFVAGWLGASRDAGAGPLEDLKAVSGIPSLDAARLKKGEILAERGGKGSFARGVYIESCFFVRRPPAAVAAAMTQWDPAKHPDEDVAAYQLYKAPGAADWARVAELKPDRSSDRWLLEQTAAVVKSGKSGDLHLAPAEVTVLRDEKGGPSAGWARVLRARAEAVAAGGLGGSPAYAVGDVKIAAHGELWSLLGMAPKIAARFLGLTGGGADVSYYAERGLTQGHTSFSLGTLAAQQTADSWQVMDCTYWTSDTYFMSADLYALWPWEGGTLVWQVDYISAPFRGYTAGLDKVFAGREMLKETASSIETFRRAVEK